MEGSVSYDWYLREGTTLSPSGLHLIRAQVGDMTSANGVPGRLLVEGRIFEVVMDEAGCLLLPLGSPSSSSKSSGEWRKIPIMNDIFSLSADDTGWFPDELA